MQPPKTTLHRVLLAVGTLTLLTAFTPNASAQATSGLEDFERCAILDQPDETGSTCITDLYTYSTTGTGSTVIVGTPAQGTRSFRMDGTNAASMLTANYMANGNFCSNDGGGNTAHFKINYDTLPPAGEQFVVGITDDADFQALSAQSYVAIILNDAGAVLINAKRQGTTSPGAGTVAGLTVAPDTWYEFEIECISGTTVIVREYTSITSGQVTPGAGGGWGDIDQMRFEVGASLTGGTGATTGRYFLDDIQYPPPLFLGSSFAAIPALAQARTAALMTLGMSTSRIGRMTLT